jgi:hypothetical protein
MQKNVSGDEFVSLFNWNIKRDAPGESDYGSAIGVLNYLTQKHINESLVRLADMIVSDKPDSIKSIEMPDVLPKYILLSKKDLSTSVRQLACK